MKKLLNPWWIFLVHTLPLLILFFISFSEYSIIKSLLSEEDILIWRDFCGVFCALLLINAGYAGVKLYGKMKVDGIYSVINIIASVVFLYHYYQNSTVFIPWNIPSWMTSGNLLAYSGAFFMPSLLYNIFCLIILLTKEPEIRKPWIDLGAAMLVPVLFYVFGIMIVPYWSDSSFSFSFVIILGITGIFIFLFFILRFFYILKSKNDHLTTEVKCIMTIAFGIVLPVAGLLLNHTDNIIGDFSDSWFYVIAVINGVALTIPALSGKLPRLILYIIRCITFSFTLYFTIVFLPLLPLGIILIIAAGIGVLMLTPLVLFLIHSSILWSDYAYLKNYYRSSLLILIAIGGLFVLPLALSGKYYIDKVILFNTLEYIYSPDYSKNYHLNNKSIQKTLDALNSHNPGNGFLYSSTPFLESLYRKIVFNNLGLSYEKKKTLSDIFQGKRDGVSLKPNREIKNNRITIADLTSASYYDVQRKVWVSTIELDIVNGTGTRWNTEYLTYFELPAGCWISDYYLYVNGIKEPGILAEKKSATWIFSQIRNQHRDPGLLTYMGGNTIEFKVFPFEIDEVRKTGIEFIHIEPVELTIDSHTVFLGERSGSVDNYLSSSLQPDKDSRYISAKEKESLPDGNPQPYYHFIVDVSGNKWRSSYDDGDEIADRRSAFEYDIRRFLEQNPIASDTYKITYANYRCHTVEKKTDDFFQLEWYKDIPSSMKPFTGGFFFQRAVEEVLTVNFQNTENAYPVIILLTEDMHKAVITDGFDDLQFTYPYANEFYWLKGNCYLSIPLFGEWDNYIVDRINSFCLFKSDNHMLLSYEMVSEDERGSGHVSGFTIPEVKVKEYTPSYFIPDDGNPSIVLTKKKNQVSEFKVKEIGEKSLDAALEIEARRFNHALNPKMGEKEWLPMLQASFASRILTPETAYIVVETEAQRLILKRKQEEVMSGNKNMDPESEAMRMSEPDLLILLLLLGILVFINTKKIKFPGTN